MECVWDDALLRHTRDLPPELLQIIQHGSDEQYLGAIAQAFLDHRFTQTLTAHCAPILPYIAGTLRSCSSQASAIATLGRVIPIAPHLKSYATQLLDDERYAFGSSQEEDLRYLLGLFRLLSNDWRAFKPFVKASEISDLLESSSRPIVYLAIRILQIYLHGADHWFEEMIFRYIGEDIPENGIDGAWDDRTIDYRFLTLWEEERIHKFTELVDDAKVVSRSSQLETRRVLSEHIFHQSAALIGDRLLPKTLNTSSSIVSTGGDVIETASTHQSLCKFASALQLQQPILLSGPAGSGKTLLIRHVARKLGRLESMVTLHLNEQSDTKLLMGIHTTGDTPGTFVWKPGVLTQAVEEGRWVLIEDLDRAPKDIIGALLPLIERGELMIPNRKQTLHAAPGFRLLATMRSQINHRGENITPNANILGARHWHNVTIVPSCAEEIRHVCVQLFPSIQMLLPQFMAVYERLQAYRQSVGYQGHRSVRDITIRDLLTWCSRAVNLLHDHSSFTSHDLDNIFLEAIDCFAGSIAERSARSDMVALIAEELHLDPQRRDHLVDSRDAGYAVQKAQINVGRYRLARSNGAKKVNSSQESFSTNPHTCRMLERVAAAVANREPLLLVGETGVGKTTAVQHLANHLGMRLVPFNLSQQSEVGDLLGGFKPVNTRNIVIPMKDEFDELFAAGFSRTKNQQFLDLLGRQMSKSNWKAVCKLWRQALQMVDDRRSDLEARSSDRGEASNKRRKIEAKKPLDATRWETFAAKVSDLEKRLAAGTNAFAFTFVEGNIVKAVRDGDWILLDEINLASPDTLESIADLFDPTNASVLLTESGSLERVHAHPNFRVFAAMNPATDVGKKDLPPAIRSRFTELYVESPDKDLKSLQSIVRSYLSHEVSNDQAIALDISILYKSIVEMAEGNRLVDGAGQRPHFSLRTLTRMLSYAKYIAPMCSLRRALYEGFHMSFLTFLDAESSRIVEPLLQQHIFSKKASIRAELSKALQKPNDGHEYIQGFPGSKHWIRRGKAVVEEQPHYILTPFIRRNLENLVRAASTRKFPVLLQGPTSSGKTSMIEYLAKRSGHKFVRINNHEHTDLQEYLGTYISGTDGRLQFQEGVLVKALREGHWIVLDELNLAPTDVLEALNRLLDDNRELLIPETQEYVRPHEDFMLFATQNPAGLYGGRKILSRAFRNRFLELHFDDIPIEELQEILHKRTQLPESRCRRIVAVYRELSVLRQESRVFEQRSFATLRDLFRWALRPNDLVDNLAENGFMLLAERVRKEEERQKLKEVLEKVMSANGPRVHLNPDVLYGTENAELRRFQQQVGDSNVVWTKAMRRLYTLVAKATQNNEPVLLVGETGCGKTTVCQMLADAFCKELHTINAHQNTETGDIIGSQRPIRNRAAIEALLRDQLLNSTVLQSSSALDGSATDALLEAYDRGVATLPPAERIAYTSSSLHEEIQSNRARFKALFQWADGSLVQAMTQGSFFLLDEISLADDSVLERLNSVLESQRSITLAEKGSLDSFVTAAPGFQFFATMNPSGDYGKRELSPALRNRFTEIWVPPLNDVDDIILILVSQLPEEARGYAPGMVAFSQWFNGRYNMSASSSVSIRDMLAWARFITEIADCDAALSVVHGAAMVYIDALGANPAGLMTVNTKSLHHERILCVEKLGELLQIEASAMYSTAIDVTVKEDGLRAGPFFLSRRTDFHLSAPRFSFDPPTTRMNAMRIVRAMQLPKPILLEGDPGVGKTAMVGALAQAAGGPLTRINLSEQTDLLDLFGSDVPVEGSGTGTFAWRDAAFLRAMKNGEWVLLDEMNLASQSVLEGLNACLDHRGEVYIPELGQTFTRHPNFRLFAAQNPHHQGGGRKGLPASFVNRFTVVFADTFRSEDLLLIAHQLYPSVQTTEVQQVVSFVEQLQHQVVQSKRFGANGGPWEFNLRDITRWLSLASSNRGLLKSAAARDLADVLFIQRFRSERDRISVDGVFRQIYDNTHLRSDLFPNTSTTSFQLGIGKLSRHPTNGTPQYLSGRAPIARSRLAIMQSIMICVQENWPVILTGASGSGKSQMILELSRAVGAEITTIAMNADSDAMDLIGGFEQADPQRNASRIRQSINARLTSLLKMHLHEGASKPLITLLAEQDSGSSTSRLSKLLASGELANLADDLSLPSLLQDLQVLKDEISKAQFEWVDGILVDALQEGKWLVLDNANLCNPSVLDRLNSLLEPNGTLIVNEHSTDDGAPRILHPHPNFRIFLTCDPKYGDLSRAMRNRAVELHLLQNANHDKGSRLALLHPESILTRFRLVKTLHATLQHNTNITANIEILADHFGSVHSPLLARFLSQLKSGLYCLPEETVRDLEYAWSNASHAALHGTGAVMKSNVDSRDQVQAHADCASVQTFHPLNNQALVLRSESTFSHATHAAFIYEIAHQFSLDLNYLRNLQSNQPQVDHIRRLERSLSAFGVPITSNMGGNSILTAIETCLSTILEGAKEIEKSSTSISTLKRTTEYMMTIWRVLMQYMGEESMDATTLMTYWASAKILLSEKLSPLQTIERPFFAKLQGPLTKIFAIPKEDQQQTCLALWSALRPETPTTESRMESLANLESLVDQFDHVCWTFELPFDMAVELRRSFTRTLALATRKDQDVEQLFKSLQTVMDETTSADHSGELKHKPHFLGTFLQMLDQFMILDLAGAPIQDDLTYLELLSLQKTTFSTRILKHGKHSPSQSCFRLLRGAVQGVLQQDMDGSASLMQSLATVDNVDLFRLKLLNDEMRVLGKAIATHPHQLCQSQISLRNPLKTCLELVLSTLADSTIEALATPCRQLSDLLVDTHQSRNNEVEILYRGAHGMTEAVRRLRLVSRYCAAPNVAGEDDIMQAADAWASFALVCLQMYIPAVPFDPALSMSFRQKTYSACSDRISSRLYALKTLRSTITSQTDILRTRNFEEDIAALGQEHFSPPYRPRVSRFTDLRTDLDNLLRTLQPLSKLTGTLAAALPLNESTIANIIRVRARLECNYREYADFVEPILSFIDCLLLGQKLASRYHTGYETSRSSSACAELVPFAEATWDSWKVDTVFISSAEVLHTWSERLLWLHALAMRTAIFPLGYTSLPLLRTIHDIFRGFYSQWKAELERGQLETASKSNIYKFKGQSESDEDLTNEELEDLFPGEYDIATPTPAESVEAKAQNTVHAVAKVHAALFSPVREMQSSILGLLRRWVRTTAHSGISKIDHSTIPALFDRIESLQEDLAPTEAPAKFNIYRDANLQQVNILLSIVQSAVRRFTALNELFKDVHTKPEEVLQICGSLLQTPIFTPLSQILPQLERLLVSVSDWQSVASREYSVVDQVDAITNLIIGWRRLELSSWAGLFENERIQCTKDATSWWYIAYESIIATCPDHKESPKELEDFAQTLASFVESSGLGQYDARLKILKSFQDHLEIYRSAIPALAPRLHILQNLRSYYGHFLPKVNEAINNGRTALEKEVKSIIQIASWKDRNIEVLRQSAKSSHKRLGRMVRKLRRLLAQPVLPIVNADMPMGNDQTSTTVTFSRTQQEISHLITPSDDVVPSVWRQRPSRFRNVVGTFNAIRVKTDQAVVDLDLSERLQSFSDGLKHSIAELRKATPSALTEENKTLVAHLKTRKRRLLADVLRDLRKMGFSFAMNERALAAQSSTNIIFASLPAMKASDWLPALQQAEKAFHRLLGLMPTARECARKHSEDLTSAEIARSLSLLESVFEVGVAQHRSIADAVEGLSVLQGPLRQLREFGKCATQMSASLRASSFTTRYRQANMMSPVLLAARNIVNCQAKLSGADYSQPAASLDARTAELAAILTEADQCPDLPGDVESDSHRVWLERFDMFLTALDGDLKREIGMRLELEPLLSHIFQWTSSKVSMVEDTAVNGRVALDAAQWTDALFQTLDKVLARITGMENVATEAKKQQNHDRLVEQQRLIRFLGGELHSTDLADSLASLSSLLAHVSFGDSTTLTTLSAIVGNLMPILDAYQAAILRVLDLSCQCYMQICITGYILASNFVQLAQNGFCSPSEKDDGPSKAGDVESGTGLGDGEGGEDISGDIGDDEDLSELAQGNQREKESGELEDVKDAVDMADEEFEGELGEVPQEDEPADEEDDQNGDGSDNSDDQAEEGATGPDATDEKMWDDAARENEKEKEADGKAGKPAANDNVAEGAEQNGEQISEQENAEDSVGSDGEVEDEKDAGEETADRMDPYTNEADKLDLPDDINMDGGADNEIDEDSEDDPVTPEGEIGNESPQIDVGTPSHQLDQEDQSGDAAEDQPEIKPEEGEDAMMEDAEQEHDDSTDEMLLQEQHAATDAIEQPADASETGTGPEENNASKETSGIADDGGGEEEETDTPQAGGTDAASGTRSGQDKNTEDPQSDSRVDKPMSAYKRLGDVLEQWYDQHRDIEAPNPSNNDEANPQQDITDSRFEHLPDEGAQSDAQALGAASMDNAAPLNKDNAIEIDEDDSHVPQTDQFPPDQANTIDNDEALEPEPTTRIGQPSEMQTSEPQSAYGQTDTDVEMDDALIEEVDDVEGVDEQLTNTHLSPEEAATILSPEQAQEQWAKYDDSTRNLALSLCEQLRLILHPTQATRMRGDFRTGKRLNIKKIIPYIASSYKRDKIWMRRSVPSKRSYQVMLAIDDSKSMTESNSHELAFETLALIARSLSTLEVGELSVIGFGENVEIAHDFGTPFTTNSGPHMLQTFTFTQSKTDVQRLLSESIEIFRNARMKAASSASDLWQLQLIISDGICEDHPTIRQLVRQAHEERIMVVFIVVDPAAQTTTGGDGHKQSILDLQTAEFAKGESGEMQVKMAKYLDTFPFRYYLIVRDVQDLPGVLAGALRQWFAETVEASG